MPEVKHPTGHLGDPGKGPSTPKQGPARPKLASRLSLPRAREQPHPRGACGHRGEWDPHTTPRSQMMFMRSCTPLTPWGILVKSSLPMAFCLVLKGRWSEATMFRVSLQEDRAVLLMARPGRLGHSQLVVECRGSSAPREWSTHIVGCLRSSMHREQGTNIMGCSGISMPGEPGA